MAEEWIVPLLGDAVSENVGRKAMQINYLLNRGFVVPPSFACVWDAYERSLVDKTAVVTTLHQSLSQKLDVATKYAVRSSANVEDSGAYSFAGQFDTVLDVSGVDGLMAAIERVWASARVETTLPYLEKAGLRPTDLKMGVVIQEMVRPVVSGVSFSKNPMTGTDEVIVEAVVGNGESLVQAGVTPDRWVHKWGDWMAEPEESEIPVTLIESVVLYTQHIAEEFKAPVDLEWVWNGTAVHWVQLRPITTAQKLNIYSNRISREVLPGIIKPLIWSVNVPMVNSAWIDLFTEMIGRNDIAPDDLSKSFFYRAYFNMATIGRVFTALGMPTETLELMMGMEGGDEKPKFRPSFQIFRHLPRMLGFMVDKLRFGQKIEAFLPLMAATYGKFSQTNVSALSARALIAEIERLYEFTKQAAYYNIVGPLLMAVYSNMFQKRVEKLGVDFVQFDLMQGVDEWEQYDPTVHLAELHERFVALPDRVQTAVCEADYDSFIQMKDSAALSQFQQDMAEFVTRFGHFSNSGNDFSAVPWRENGELVLQMIVTYVPPENGNRKLGWDDLPIRGIGRLRLKLAYRQARQFRLYREAISFWYTFGYGLFRNLMLALGKQLVVRELITARDDIFYLYLDEVKQLVNNEQGAMDARALVAQRKAEIEAVRDVILPDIIFGDEAPPPETTDEPYDSLQGIPTSRGYCKGPARVIRSIEEFGKMQMGDIIVIPFSDVSWTPLFSKAGAVIAESGGMLSHSSIVAREYGLPAVVSVTGACRLLADGVIVSVDGYKGEILVHETTEVA